MTYSITAGNTGNAFTINSSTGAITTAAALDYETTTSYTLTITATDSFGNATTTTQTVNVTDVNEVLNGSSIHENILDLRTYTPATTVARCLQTERWLLRPGHWFR